MLKILNLFASRAPLRQITPEGGIEVVDIVLDPSLAGRKHMAAPDDSNHAVPATVAPASDPLAVQGSSSRADSVEAGVAPDSMVLPVDAQSAPAAPKKKSPTRKLKPASAVNPDPVASAKSMPSAPKKRRPPSMKPGSWTLPAVKPVVLQYVDSVEDGEADLKRDESRASALAQ